MGSGVRAGWQADRVYFHRIGPAGSLCSGIRGRARRRTWWASGARFPETAPGWCAGGPMAASYFTWAWTTCCMRCRLQGPLEFGEPKPLFRIAGRPAIRHHPGLSIRCFAGRAAVRHADNRLRSAASFHGDRELARQISPVVILNLLSYPDGDRASHRSMGRDCYWLHGHRLHRSAHG